MLKILQDDKKQISYKAVMKKEMDVCVTFLRPLRGIHCRHNVFRKKEMGGDENMVLNHIQTAGNEGERSPGRTSVAGDFIVAYSPGIWTKHLKSKTELHQTIITRCLKSLEQKGLVKNVKSVKVYVSS